MLCLSAQPYLWSVTIGMTACDVVIFMKFTPSSGRTSSASPCAYERDRPNFE